MILTDYLTINIDLNRIQCENNIKHDGSDNDNISLCENPFRVIHT